MKRIGLVLLVVSLAGNVALLVAPPGAADASKSRAGAGDSGSGDGQAGAHSASAQGGDRTATAGRTGSAAGRALASGDPAVVRDRLRAEGFPEEYVRAVIWDRIQRRHAAARRDALAGSGLTPFWKARDIAAEQNRHTVLLEIDRAMRDEFRKHFDEGMGDAARLRQQQARLPFLSREKVAAVMQIDADYGELTRNVRTEMFTGIQLDEDRQKLALLEEGRRADLAALLTPEELELYDLHTSPTARSMRSRLAYFEPTEAEFRTIFALQRAFDAEFGAINLGPTYGPPSQEVMRRRGDATRELRQQIMGALGPARAAEYERATNYGYMAAVKITDHFQLPRENAAAVYALESEYQRRREETARAFTEDPQQRTEAIRALGAEAAARMTALLGEEGARAFRETGGRWLRSLEPQGQRSPAVPRP